MTTCGLSELLMAFGVPETNLWIIPILSKTKRFVEPFIKSKCVILGNPETKDTIDVVKVDHSFHTIALSMYQHFTGDDIRGFLKESINSTKDVYERTTDFSSLTFTLFPAIGGLLLLTNKELSELSEEMRQKHFASLDKCNVPVAINIYRDFMLKYIDVNEKCSIEREHIKHLHEVAVGNDTLSELISRMACILRLGRCNAEYTSTGFISGVTLSIKFNETLGKFSPTIHRTSNIGTWFYTYKNENLFKVPLLPSSRLGLTSWIWSMCDALTPWDINEYKPVKLLRSYIEGWDKDVETE